MCALPLVSCGVDCHSCQRHRSAQTSTLVKKGNLRPLNDGCAHLQNARVPACGPADSRISNARNLRHSLRHRATTPCARARPLLGLRPEPWCTDCIDLVNIEGLTNKMVVERQHDQPGLRRRTDSLKHHILRVATIELHQHQRDMLQQIVQHQCSPARSCSRTPRSRPQEGHHGAELAEHNMMEPRLVPGRSETRERRD